MALPDDFDYSLIDCEIRPLIRLMNELPGITTLFSCAGHDENHETYVAFTSDSQENLWRLLVTLPFLGPRIELVRNEIRTKSILVTPVLNPQNQLQYRLSVYGSPLYIQRQLLGDIEKALGESGQL